MCKNGESQKPSGKKPELFRGSLDEQPGVWLAGTGRLKPVSPKSKEPPKKELDE